MKNPSLIDSSGSKVATVDMTDTPEKLVDATSLLALLWDGNSRPSLRWLRANHSPSDDPFYTRNWLAFGRRRWCDGAGPEGKLSAGLPMVFTEPV
jgi:hypothetical protein